jgi:methyl-accepting chemotaxis protein
MDNINIDELIKSAKGESSEEKLVIDESKNINPGDEIELIKNIKKELEQDKKVKASLSYKQPRTHFLFISDDLKLKIKKYILKTIKFLQFSGILFIVLGGLFLANLFIHNNIVLIVLYLIAIFIISIYYLILSKFLIDKSMNKPLEILGQVSKGKLSFDILSNAELKKELGKFAIPLDTIIKTMSDMVSKIELSALDLAGNSDALSYFAASMASKTMDQADSIDIIDDSAKNLNDSMQEIKISVETAYEISKTSIEEANNSSVEILSLIEEMNRINEMSDKILTTMNFIDDIAAETNLLALNAAIQAAHAGEEGKGFGVVAGEIKNLAQSSSKATKTIYEIIEKTVESISKGVKASEKAKKELVKIISSIKTTEDLMSKINESINMQSSSTGQLKENLANIRELTNNINSDTQNIKTAIANLSGQAQILTKLISFFEVNSSNKINTDSIYGIES